MHPKLYEAATSGNVHLLNEVADANIEDLLSQVPHKNTALHIAARLGHLQFIEEILHRQPQLLRMQNSQGDTALHQALRNIQIDVAVQLLHRDPELALVTNNEQESPLHLAVKEELQRVVQEILGASLPNSGEETAIYISGSKAADRNISAISAVRKRDLVAIKDSTGRTALHYASWRNTAATVDLILRIDPHIVPYETDRGGFSPLHVAAAFGCHESISKLLKRCPDATEQVDTNGRNALHIAVLNLRLESVFGLLRTSNAEHMLKLEDKEGNTPQSLAASDEYAQTAQSGRSIFLQEMDRGAIRILMNKASERPSDHSIPRKFLETRTQSKEALPRGQPRMMRPVIPEVGIAGRDAELKEKWADNVEKTYMVIAGLIATVTFAAGIAAPGGFKNSDEVNPGSAVLTDQKAFQAFIFTNAIAMFSSLTAMLVFTSGKLNREFRGHFTFLGAWVTMSAWFFMMLAFVAGIYAVVSPGCKWLAQLVLFYGALYGLLSVGPLVIPWLATIGLGQNYLRFQIVCSTNFWTMLQTAYSILLRVTYKTAN